MKKNLLIVWGSGFIGRALSVKTIISKKVGSVNPTFGEIPYRNGENMESFADISNAKKILNWSPELPLEEGIEKTINYFKLKI